MKVILLQDVKKLGKKGEIVEVSDGYGRNYLLARKLAAPGTSENINDAKQKKPLPTIGRRLLPMKPLFWQVS